MIHSVISAHSEGAPPIWTSMQAPTSTPTPPPKEDPTNPLDDDDVDEDPLYRQMESIDVLALEKQVMLDHLAWEYHCAEEELTRARLLLRVNNIPFGDTDDDHGSPSQPKSKSDGTDSDPKVLTKESSGWNWKTGLVKTCVGLLLLLMILLILMEGIQSLMKSNSCFNPFNFKSVGDYLASCGPRESEPRPI